MAKQSYDFLQQTRKFVRICGISIYFWFSLLSDSFQKEKKHKRVWKVANQEKKEIFGHSELVSPVIGGWARCAPSPTTGAAGHDIAAA
jgi:hypothetical protein